MAIFYFTALLILFQYMFAASFHFVYVFCVLRMGFCLQFQNNLTLLIQGIENITSRLTRNDLVINSSVCKTLMHVGAVFELVLNTHCVIDKKNEKNEF